MGQKVKQITDPGQLKQIIEKLFLKYPVQLKEKKGVSPAEIAGYDGSSLYLVPVPGESKLRLILLSHNENNMYLECEVLERTSESEKLKPVRLHLQRQVRNENRVEVPREDENVLYVTDLINIKSFPEAFSVANDKRDTLKAAYRNELKRHFPLVDIVFRLTVRLDYRMRVLNLFQRAIYVPNNTAPDHVDQHRFVPYGEYLKLAQYEKIPEGYIAEVSEPLIYRNNLLVGYIRVASYEPIELEQYEHIAAVGAEFVKNLELYRIIPRNAEKSPVLDIHMSGIGFMHSHIPSIIKNFMPGEHVIFTIRFPGGKNVTYNGVIKNMKSQENAHRFGIQFENLKPDQTDALQTYLAALSDQRMAQEERQSDG